MGEIPASESLFFWLKEFMLTTLPNNDRPSNIGMERGVFFYVLWDFKLDNCISGVADFWWITCENTSAKLQRKLVNCSDRAIEFILAD